MAYSTMLRLSKFVVVVISAVLIAIPIRANAASLNEESIATVTHEEVTCADISTCSWYGGEATFTFTHTTTPRYYDGTNVGIEMTCSSSKDGSFVVELWRGSSKLGGSYVGRAEFSRQGFTKATWSNVGSGNYFFVFTNNAGTPITCSGIAMYSW